MGCSPNEMARRTLNKCQSIHSWPLKLHFGKIIFGTTDDGLTRMGREAQGCAWASQAGDALSNPFASELARDCKTPSLILLRKWPCFLRFAQDVENRKKHRVALGLQVGRCCEKASASALASVFSATDPALAQRINPSILSLLIRVYLSHPWLKCLPLFFKFC